MENNKLYCKGNTVIRVLKVLENQALVIDCLKLTMPTWKSLESLSEFEETEDSLIRTLQDVPDMESVDAERLNAMHKKYSSISNILPFIHYEKERNKQIAISSERYNLSKQTIRKYLCRYLVFNDIRVLIPNERSHVRDLTLDEKNMRWSLNKYFYTYQKNSLKTAYKFMLKEKYCDQGGNLLDKYPSFNQYRYFYRKNKKMQNYLITRNGLTNYQRNDRPCLGDGVREFAPTVGTGMIDSTVCDIYLVNSSGELIGRPILTACVDAFSGLCCGYSLTLEGGIYSIKEMMLNIIVDKVEHCKKYGIFIEKEQWPSSEMLGIMVTDRGAEYVSQNFEQVSELGITIVNLPPYRPELKGSIEKLFDLIQNEYEPYLKGKGIIAPDYQERGAHDYRKDACLTMKDFEKIVIRCIVFHNSCNVVEKFPFTDEMISAGIKPYHNALWNWGAKQAGCNLISLSRESVILALLPRTTGVFNRYGLNVNKMRYRRDGFTEYYLSGRNVTVAYNPEDVSNIWLVENGKYIEFELIEARFKNKNISQVHELQQQQQRLIKDAKALELQEEINLASDIEIIAANCHHDKEISTNNIKENRTKEMTKNHIDHTIGVHKK